MDSTHLHEGMAVYGPRGEKLGKVARCDEQTFVVERGVLFHKEYVARYEDVAEVSPDDVRLARGEEALGFLERGTPSEGPLGEASPTGAGGGAETIPTSPVSSATEEPAPAMRREPGPWRAARDGDEAGATVTYGMGEDSGATQARRDDFDVDEG